MAAALGIAFYTLLEGAGPSVIRETIMGFFRLLASQVDEGRPGPTAWQSQRALCAFLIPTCHGMSFQLSFMATLGLILYARPLQTAFERA